LGFDIVLKVVVLIGEAAVLRFELRSLNYLYFPSLREIEEY
jgi:hypothetical protein